MPKRTKDPFSEFVDAFSAPFEDLAKGFGVDTPAKSSKQGTKRKTTAKNTSTAKKKPAGRAATSTRTNKSKDPFSEFVDAFSAPFEDLAKSFGVDKPAKPSKQGTKRKTTAKSTSAAKKTVRPASGGKTRTTRNSR